MAGKGSRARPLSITKSQFGDNWDAIFGNKSDDAKNVAKPADRTNTVLKNTNTNGKLTFEDWKATHLHILQAAEAKLANVTGIDITKEVDKLVKQEYNNYLTEFLKQRLS